MEINTLSRIIIGCAIEVHKNLGPGMLESAYEKCLCYELFNKRLHYEVQKPIPVIYKELQLEYGYRADIIVENQILLELKSIDLINPVHEAQLLTYLQFSKLRLGLLINFNVKLLKDGIVRIIL